MSKARKHPPVAIGDKFGSNVVIAIAPRDHTSNERVEVRCKNCRHTRIAYVFNLRKSLACARCPRKWRIIKSKKARAA